MTTFGVDYSSGYDIPSLVAGGAKFAARYIGFADMSLQQTKMITYSEAYDLFQAGISIVSIWEWTADRASIHNTFYNGSSSLAFAGGVADAIAASKLHKSIGGPSTKPIYFAIDFSTDGTDCVDYFKGVVSVLGLANVGAYGPPAAITYLQSQHLVTYLWGWSSGGNLNIAQTATGVVMGRMVVDTDIAQFTDFGQWSIASGLAPKPVWYQYPICVPFGNANFDVGLGGSHDLDVQPPPNLPVTSLVSGVISDISAPTWGKQVCVKLDTPISGHEYFGHLHLSATNPNLSVGQHINEGALIGWVGGANNSSQYMNTTNPTGSNFIDDPGMSSQVQVGIALHDGPAYGGVGWVKFPPIETSLDPSSVLLAAREGTFIAPPPVNANQRKAFEIEWTSEQPQASLTSGIAQQAWADYQANKFHGPATSLEYEDVDWNGNSISAAQNTHMGTYHWINGNAVYYPYH